MSGDCTHGIMRVLWSPLVRVWCFLCRVEHWTHTPFRPPDPHCPSPYPAKHKTKPSTGIVRVGDEVEIIGMKEGVTKSTVTGVEMFKKLLQEGQAGDNVGLLLRGIKREDVQRGQVGVVCVGG